MVTLSIQPIDNEKYDNRIFFTIMEEGFETKYGHVDFNSKINHTDFTNLLRNIADVIDGELKLIKQGK